MMTDVFWAAVPLTVAKTGTPYGTSAAVRVEVSFNSPLVTVNSNSAVSPAVISTGKLSSSMPMFLMAIVFLTSVVLSPIVLLNLTSIEPSLRVEL